MNPINKPPLKNNEPLLLDNADFSKYGEMLDWLAKQVKEAAKKNIEQKEAKNKIYPIVVDAYRLLIDKLWFKINSFHARLEIQVLNNDIKTKKLLSELRTEILEQHATRERLKEKNRESTIERQKVAEDTPKIAKKRETTKWTTLKGSPEKDDPELLRRAAKNRENAAQRVSTFIDTFGKEQTSAFKKWLGSALRWLQERAQ